MLTKESYIVGTAIALMLAGLLAFPASGLADKAQSCTYIGSWYGSNPQGVLEWIINVQGPSQTSGTNNLESLTFDWTLGGAFPNALRSTALRGVWEKVGGNTYGITMIGYNVDGNGFPVWIGKMSGTATLIDDCTKESLDLTLEIFLPDQDPFAEEALFGIPLPNHEGYRMRVDPPYPY